MATGFLPAPPSRSPSLAPIYTSLLDSWKASRLLAKLSSLLPTFLSLLSRYGPSSFGLSASTNTCYNPTPYIVAVYSCMSPVRRRILRSAAGSESVPATNLSRYPQRNFHLSLRRRRFPLLFWYCPHMRSWQQYALLFSPLSFPCSMSYQTSLSSLLFTSRSHFISQPFLSI